MKTQNDRAVAAGFSVDLDRWADQLDELLGWIAGRFPRVEPRRRAAAFVRGLLAGLPRPNCWTLAEHAGDRSPDGMQHLLARACWDHDGVRDDLRSYVVEHLGDPDAVLVVDETGDLKKGNDTVGVCRQYTGTAGRVDNAQVGVYLSYATGRGHAFIDRSLYLPSCWVEDPARVAAAGVPAVTPFATKPQLAAAMLERALDAGTPARWVAADEVYGNNPDLRALMERRGIGYVLEVARHHRVPTCGGLRRPVDLAASVPASTWRRLSAGTGSKGQRWYAWALIDVEHPDRPGQHGLLIRRHLRDGDLAFYHTRSPTPVPMAALVAVAGSRWRIEENIQAGKGLAALDDHQVRRWTSWHRWTVLAMLAHAFLAVTAAADRAHHTNTELIPLTCNEIRHLFATITRPLHGIGHLLHWSRWRRRHQTRARASHYKRQAASSNDHELRL